MTYRGRVKDGAIILDQPLQLPEGAEVLVQPLGDEQSSIWRKLLELAGTVKDLPPDAADNHDHYLYGTPKR